MSFDYASLARRISALEANRGGSLRFGTVTEVSEADGTARVQLPDGQGLVSMPLRVLSRRALKDKIQCFPDIGEPVACLFSGQGLEQGVILGAYYHGQNDSPDQPSGIDYTVYEDGAEIWYDRSEHKLIAKIPGDAEIEAEGNIKATSEKNVEVTAQGDIKATSAKSVEVSAAAEIILRAPQIVIEGNLAQRGYKGGTATSELHGTYTVREGSIHVPDQDVTAGSVSVRGHMHEGVQPGPGASGKPVGG